MKGSLSKLIESKMSEAYKKLSEKETGRDYIGASAIGSDCWRQIWYEFKGYKGNEDISNAIRRTWKIGKLLESMILDLLEEIAILVVVPNESNNYLAYQDDELPYFKGHADAILCQPLRLLELKAVKDASFKMFQKNGFKSWNKKYFDQVQSYMGMSGCKESYVLMINKDTSELHDELVTFDQTYYDSLKQKAKMIYNAKEPPPRINNSPLWFQCKLCKFNKECHK